MVSNLKRYKSMFSSTKSMLIKQMEGIRILKARSCYFNDLLYGVSFSMEFEWNPLDLAIYEQGSQVVIGLNLNQTPQVRIQCDRGQALDSYIWDIIYSSIKWGYFSDKEKDALAADLGFSLSEFTDKTRQKEFYQSKAYARIDEILEDSCTDFTITSEISQGNWPTLKRRDILPLMLFDFSEGKESVYYNTRSSVDSYRKDRDYSFILGLNKNPWTVISKVKIPVHLFSSTYNNKYAGKMHI